MKTYTIEGHEIIILGGFVLYPPEVERDPELWRKVVKGLRVLLEEAKHAS